MKRNSLLTGVLLVLALIPLAGRGQSPKADKQYIVMYDSLLVGRFYFSQKYTSISLRSGDHRLWYRPNTTFNVGIGATYRWFSLNLAYKAPGLNNDEERGKTKYLDLQAHIYPRYWAIDFYGQNYHGYHSDPIQYPGQPGTDWYLRPDIKLNLYGLSAYRLHNGNRFSFRAPFLQNEWQHRSSGTWMYGAELHGAVLKADSSLVPNAKATDFAQAGVNQVKWLQVGIGGGYAYTLVIARHFFLTAAATVSAQAVLAETQQANATQSKLSFGPNYAFKAAVGYNSDRWMVCFTNAPNRMALRNLGWNDPTVLSTGNYRFNIAHRFVPGARLRKKLRVLDPKR